MVKKLDFMTQKHPFKKQGSRMVFESVLQKKVVSERSIRQIDLMKK